MASSLYDMSVASYIQLVDAVGRVLDRGLEHCRSNGMDPETIVESRVHPDMLPFRFQIQSVAHHSINTVNSIMEGVFHPPRNLPEHNYEALQALINDASRRLREVTPEEMNAREGEEVIFEMGDTRLPFTAEDFVLTFSFPNLCFHAATAYDILRGQGVPLGKRDYLGRLRLKQS